MGLFQSTPAPMARTLRALARLLGYPDAELRAGLPLLRDALRREAALPTSRLAELEALLAEIARAHPLDAEVEYVQLFDSGRRTALHLFEHVHGDSRERGPAMIDLAQTYERAGLWLAEGEMPDDLRVLLEFASTQPPREAQSLLAEFAHLIDGIHAALQQRGSRYAAVMGALLDLAGATPGTHARAVPQPHEAPLDESWQEPEAFDGCASAGARAGQAPAHQPIHVVRPAGPRREPSAPGAAA